MHTKVLNRHLFKLIWTFYNAYISKEKNIYIRKGCTRVQLYRLFSIHLQIMPLENEMKTPKAFMKPFGVLNVSMSIIVAMYAALGFFGYIRYAHEMTTPKSDGSITLNLPKEALGIAVQILLAVAIFFTHPIQCYVAIDIVWNEYISPHMEKYRYKLLWEYITRTIIILLTCEYILTQFYR